MPELGWAGLGVVPEVDSSFYRKLDRDIGPGLSRAGKSAGSKFGSVLGKAAAVTATGAIGAGFAAFQLGKDAVQQASTLGESLNAVSVSYGKQADAVKELGRESANALGLSNSEFNSLAVRFSAFSQTISGGGKGTVKTLDDLTTRASDFASVMNLDVSKAAELFQSGLAGETEPLRQYGIDLSAAAVEAHALAKGLVEPTKNFDEIKLAQLDAAEAQKAYDAAVKEHGSTSTEAQRAALGLKTAQDDLKAATKGSVGELTEAEKVQARYSLLMESTNQAAGDFANTSDSLANRQRILNARWDDAQAKLGTALLPILEDVTGFLLDDGIPAFEKASDFFINDFAPAAKDLADDLKPVASALGDVVGFLNDMPSEAKIAALGAVLAGGTALKLRGGKGGALGNVGSALGLAKPVPVFVTNPGFGLGGGGGTPVVTPGGVAGKGGRFAGLGKVALKGAGWVAIPAGLVLWSLESRPDRPQGDVGFVPTARAAQEGFDTSGQGKNWQGIPEAAAVAVDETEKIFQSAKIPETLNTRFRLLGMPESEKDLRHLLRVYDLTPKQKTTTLELLGYEPTLDRIRRVNKELDWAARPRDARISITKVYSAAGYETAGGLVEGGGGPVTRSRRRGGGGV